MFQHHSDSRKWVWCVLVLSSGTAWSPVSSVTVRSSEKIPSTIETQAKFFQYRHLPTSEDFDQGHRLGSDRHFIERHERSRPAAGLFFAKVRWGDKKGGYGEHYWDLNHAGHAKNQEQEEDEYDDGDYNEELQDYQETREKASNEREEYYPDASEYERNARPKRENSKGEVETLKRERNYEEKQRRKQKRSKYTEPNQTKRNLVNQDDFERDLMKTSLKDNRRYLREYNEGALQPRDKNHIALVVDHKSKAIEDAVKAEQINFVPYEVSAGLKRLIRQATRESIPRLLLESFTGHVTGRATG